MSIVYNQNAGTFTLQTLHTTYQMKIDEQGTLLHTYYGEKTDDTDKSYLIQYGDRGFSGNPYALGSTRRTYSLDVLPQEYACFGTGDYRISALKIKNQNGACGVALCYDSFEIREGKYTLPGLPAVYANQGEAQTLILTLKDPESGIRVKLYYGVLAEDLITRAAEIINEGPEPVLLQKAASLCLDFQWGSYEWLTFYGRHAMERNLQRSIIGHGISAAGSVRGTSSHHYNPFAVLCEEGTSEEKGSCYGISFLYSGEFLLEAEKDQMDQTRLLCGIHPDDFEWKLAPGESFTTPEVMLTYSNEGFGTLSRTLHRAILHHICRGEWQYRRRPILLNSWEGTYFSFTGEKLIAMAREAASLGVELFVVDDGWFGKREDDNSGLGDWYPNEKKLGCTLKELGEAITGLGMQFGIWVEPEGISEDSDLYRQHPEWAVQIPGRAPAKSRNQLVLDFASKEVQDYILERLTAVFESAPISYVKWDFNRSICDKYSSSLPRERQGEMAHRFVLGLYRVLEELGQRFPHILFEGCSGGGGRFDAGMLYYTPQIWCSDNTDAIARLKIQYGTSFGYPIRCMGAHVSAVPNHQTGRHTPLAARGCVACEGTFGYELDVNRMTAEEKKEVSAQIRQFRADYELLQFGEYYRLTSPYRSDCVVWEHVSQDGSEALICGLWQQVEANPVPCFIRVKGLQEEAFYRVEMSEGVGEGIGEDGAEEAGCQNAAEVYSGAALLHAGMAVPPAKGEYDSFRLHLVRVDAVKRTAVN